MDKGDQRGVSSSGGMDNNTIYDASDCWTVVSGLNYDERITYNLAIKRSTARLGSWLEG